MNNRTEEHRSAQRRVLIGFGVVAVLAGAGVIARRSVSHPKAEEPPDVALEGAVSCSGNEIQVTNNGSAGWMEVRVEINSKYARIVPAIAPDQNVTLPTAELTDSNGTHFDPASMKCQSADIQAFVRGGQGHLKVANLEGR
jgi:hypothetical protein